MATRRATARVKETVTRITPRSRAKGPSRARPELAAVPAPSAEAAALEALRADVAALARLVAAQTEAMERAQAVPAGSPADLAARLGRSAELLAATAADLPRADDFQPLADHLYAFAETAPRLVERLEVVRAAVAPLEAAAARLGEIAETLMATHHAWSESLLRLPRAEDYEPLTGPLREFARVSPLLAETLGAVVKAVTPLPSMVQQVVTAAGAKGASARDPLRPPLAAAADQMAAASGAIRESLASLPRDREYAEAATHLRELATVSPSLMEWLRRLPTMTVPLGDSIASLEAAARELEDAERVARDALDGTS
jgi:hypothetical protein